MKNISDIEVLMFLLVEQTFSFENNARTSSMEMKDMIDKQNKDMHKFFSQIKSSFSSLEALLKKQEENTLMLENIEKSIKKNEQLIQTKKCTHEETILKYIEDKEAKKQNETRKEEPIPPIFSIPPPSLGQPQARITPPYNPPPTYPQVKQPSFHHDSGPPRPVMEERRRNPKVMNNKQRPYYPRNKQWSDNG